MTWNILATQISIFPALQIGTHLPSAPELFRRAWGVEPDGFQRQSNPLLPNIAQGKFGTASATCSVHSNRIDFSFGPDLGPREVAPEASLRVIDDPSQLREGLGRAIDVVAAGGIVNSVGRVAFNLNLVSVCPSIREATATMLQTIPTNYGLRLAEEEDIVFQVNQPYRPDRFPDIKMNCISKWSVERFQVFRLTSINPAISEAGEFIGAMMTLDVNNSPKDDLSTDQQRELLTESITKAETLQRHFGIAIEGF
jgi:hypothetical protein